MELLKRKNLFNIVGILIPGWSILFSYHAVASEDYFDLTLEQLLEMKVLSASKKVESIADAAAAIYVVTNEDIMRAGVTTIPDALRMVPGVNVAQSDSNSWAISIRGFNSALANKLLVLLDGRTIYNPVFGGVLWEAQDLVLEDIERIEVVRGPGGTLWGANAVNGVINIITKNSRNTQGNLVSAVAGNDELGTLSTRHGGVLANDGFYRVYAKGFKRDNSLTPNGDEAYDGWDGFRTGFRADWNDSFTLQGDAYRNRTEQRRPHFSLAAPFAAIQDQTIKYDGINLLGRWVDAHEDGSQFSIQSYIDWAKRDEPINFIDDRITYDVETQYNFSPTNRNEIIAGAGLRYLVDKEIGDNNVSFSPESRHNTIYSAFLQDKITLLPQQLFVTLGSKVEHNEFSGAEVQPNIRLQWHANDNQTLWASVSRAVRTPTPIEENLTSTLATAANVRIAFVPNADFKSEKLTAYEVGYRYQITQGFSADLTTFYNDYDYLETTSVQSPTLVNNGTDPLYILVPVKFTNNMKGKSDGFEAAFNWSVNKNLKVAFNYSYLHINLTTLDPTQTGGETIYPMQQSGLRIFWNISEDWTLDTTTYYVDKLPGFNIDHYVRLDLNVGGQITPRLRFNLVGQNLLDNRHMEFGSVNDLNAAQIESGIFGKLTWIL